MTSTIRPPWQWNIYSLSVVVVAVGAVVGYVPLGRARAHRLKPRHHEPACRAVAFDSIAAGSNHTCGLRADDGSVACWGLAQGAAGWPRGVRFTQVSTGRDFSCGIRAGDGSLVCWGGQANLAVPTDGPFEHVAVNGSSVQPMQACAVRSSDGQIECWQGSPVDVPVRDYRFSRVAISNRATCGLRADTGAIVCWGEDDSGLLEAPSGSYRELVPNFLSMCAIRADDDEVVCWGTDWGQMPPAGSRFAQLALGVLAGCGIRIEDRTVQCWGSPLLQAGAPLGVAFSAIAVGGDFELGNTASPSSPNYFDHACGIRADDGGVTCWGDDRVGQSSGAPNTTRFRQVATSARILLDAQSNRRKLTQTCALRADGHALCWGGFETRLPSDLTFSQISAHCAVRANDSQVVCAAVTDPAELNALLPLATPGCGVNTLNGLTACTSDIDTAALGTVLQISQANDMLCAIRTEDHHAACSGSDVSGQVSQAPADLVLRSVATGNSHSCGIRADNGEAVCWGLDDQHAVTGIPSGRAFSQIAATTSFEPAFGFERSCGLSADDQGVVCWGDYQTPAPPSGVSFSHIDEHARCGVRADTGEVLCWNWDSLTANQTLEGDGYRSVASNGVHACAIRDDALLTCWGAILWNPL